MLQQPQQQASEETKHRVAAAGATKSADEWKRKLQREIKVNQELGRRLRELKQQLHDEKAQRQHLAKQLEDYKASNSRGADSTKECSRCLGLEEQVEQLTLSLAAATQCPQQPQEQSIVQVSNQEHDDSHLDLKELTVAQIGLYRAVGDGDSHTHSSAVTAEHCRHLQQSTGNTDALLSRTATVDAFKLVPHLAAVNPTKPNSPEALSGCARATELQQATASASIYTPLLNVSLHPSLHPSLSNQQQPPLAPVAQLHAQPPPLPPKRRRRSSLVFNTFDGLKDHSLGELFKYAIVLAGPAPAALVKRQLPPPPPQRRSFADYRRTRSLPEENHPHLQDQQQQPALCPSTLMTSPLPDESTVSTATLSPTSSFRFKLLGGGSSRPHRAQTLLEFIAGEPTASSTASAPVSPAVAAPQRKTGWLSNVAQRFRSAAPPTAPVPIVAAEAPARLTSSSSDYNGAATASAPRTTPVSPAKPASKLLCVFPAQPKAIAELEGLVELCFPYGERLPRASDFTLANLKRTLQERHRTYRSADSTFVLTIPSATNPSEITYAICVICPLFANTNADDSSGTAAQAHSGEFPKANDNDNVGSSTRTATATQQCCLCLLSPYPFFSLFFKVLFGVAALWETKRREAAEEYALACHRKHGDGDRNGDALPRQLTLQDFVEHFQTILARLQRMRAPAMGGWSRMSLAPNITQLSFHRPHSESIGMEHRTLLLEYAAPTLFALLPVDQVLFLLGCLCCEHKVLIVSNHVNIVSSCVLALITLLSPMQWAGPIITVLPPRLDELLEAPVPLIAGRVWIASAAAVAPATSYLHFSTLHEPIQGVIEMNVDQHNLVLHDDDLQHYHELKLPGCDTLVHELQRFSSQLFGKHAGDLDFPSAKQTEASDVLCTRIHRHIERICAVALGISDSEDDSEDESSGDDGNDSADGTDTSSSMNSPSASVRCSSDLTLEYLERFKGTQMFSMFQLQHQELVATRDQQQFDQVGGHLAVRNEAYDYDDEAHDYDDEDEDDDGLDACEPSECIIYNSIALCDS